MSEVGTERPSFSEDHGDSPASRGSIKRATRRVSFGSPKGGPVVETVIYEQDPAENQLIEGTSPEEHPVELSRVRVSYSESGAPTQIQPPTTPVKTELGCRKESGELPPPGGVTVAPMATPLPRPFNMKAEQENPFRPDGFLSHEVEPIIKVYKTRPFPSSSEDVGGADGDDGGAENEDGGAQSALQSPAKNGVVVEAEPERTPREARDGSQKRRSSDGASPQRKTTTSPKAGLVEVVHIDEDQKKKKKKGCTCCVVQ